MERKYKGIEFAKGYNRSFADFKKEFGSTHVFKKLLPKEKEKELKAAYKIATQGNGSVQRNSTRSKEKSKPSKD